MVVQKQRIDAFGGQHGARPGQMNEIVASQ
jgi:hypothetical protein